MWPTLLSNEFIDRVPSVLTGESGPFGRSAAKLLELLTVVVLCPASLTMGPLPSAAVTGLLVVMMVLTNLVLHAWSSLTKSRGEHAGLNRMVDGDGDGDGARAALGVKRHLWMVLLAALNALAEESVSRGLFMYTLHELGWSKREANLIQAVQFGCAVSLRRAHLRGISVDPSTPTRHGPPPLPPSHPPPARLLSCSTITGFQVAGPGLD